MTELKSEKMGITSLYKNSVIAVTVWTAMLAALFTWNYMHSSEQILQMASLVKTYRFDIIQELLADV